MPVQTREVRFSSNRRARHELTAYLAQPEEPGPCPGIVVIHEIFGLNDNIRDIARRLAGEGYAALAVDLFSGRNRAVCMFRFMTAVMRGSTGGQAVQDLKTTLSFFARQEGVDGQRLGAIGFCMGGGFAIAWACTDARLRVIAPFYARNPRPLAATARLCPVVGSYPEGDFTAPAGRRLDAALDGYGIPHDIKIYPDTRHSFFNDQGPSHNAAASADAWGRTLAFFGQHLA